MIEFVSTSIIKVINKLVINDYIFSVLSRISSVLLIMIYTIVFNRYLGAELRGESAIITNFASMFSIFVGLGMYQAYPYYRKNNIKEYQKFINCIVSYGLFVEFIAIILAFFLPIEIGKKIAVLIIPILVLQKQLNYIVLVEWPKRRNINVVMIEIISIIYMLILLLCTKANFYYLILYLVIREFTYLIIIGKNVEFKFNKFKFGFKDLKKYAKYGLIPMLTLACMTINYRIDVLMLDGKVNTSAIGIYALGISVSEKIWLVPEALKDILISRLTKGKKEKEVMTVLRFSIAGCIITMVFAVIIGRYVINILYGNEYTGAYEIMIIMLVGVIGMVFYKTIYSYNVTQGKKIINLIFLGIAALLNIIGNYFIIPIYGINGSAAISVISYCICGFCFLIYFKMKTKCKFKELILLNSNDIKTIKRKFSQDKG